MKKIILTMTLFAGMKAVAQTGAYVAQATAYIRQYKDLAIAEQRRSGVPAAITLAQGIYETQAGQSELATEANNHFGIKCKKEWTGETFAHTDDAPNECFRKYGKAEDSYRDHSDYLRKTPRYASCFALRTTDYIGWANELKRCGYATNPKYAAKLVRVVEDFHLQDYTNEALQIPVQEVMTASAANTAPQPVVSGTATAPAGTEMPAAQEAVPAREALKAEVAAAPVQELIEPETAPVYGRQVERYGLKGFYARKGDVLLEYAIKYNLRYARLLELNDLPDAPLAADMFVYLEKKHSTGLHSTHKVLPGETMQTIAQTEGIQLRQLRLLNQLEHGEEPAPGIALQLQTMTAARPALASVAPAAAPQYQASITPPESVPVVRDAAPVPTAEPKAAENAVAAVTAPPTSVPAMEEEEEEKEEPASLPAVPQRPAASAAPVAAETPAPVKQEPVKQEPVKQEPVKRQEPVAPRPQPRPTPPREKTYTIADEMAVGEENPANVKYSPRYVPAKQEAPAEAPVTQPAPPAPQPQDEFSKLKAQLDKAVYAPRKPARMEVTEETPDALKGRTTPASTPAAAEAAPQVASGNTGLHTVKNGETAFSIAKRYGMSVRELRELNNLNFEAIRVGQQLKVKAR